MVDFFATSHNLWSTKVIYEASFKPILGSDSIFDQNHFQAENIGWGTENPICVEVTLEDDIPYIMRSILKYADFLS